MDNIGLNVKQKEAVLSTAKITLVNAGPGTGKTYNAKKVIEEFLDNSIVDGKNYYDRKKEIRNPDETSDKRYQINKIKFSEFESKEDDNDFSNKYVFKLNEKFKDTPVIWEIIQFNQTYSYEDFIEGMIPTKEKGIDIKDGIFKRFAEVAEKNTDINFVLIIDEINRGKIDKIFGELLYLLEYRDDDVRLHYSGEPFSIPNNVYIIGTMNTADKSIAALDIALRRRFWFVKLDPSKDVLIDNFLTGNTGELTNKDESENIKNIALKLFEFLNGSEDGKKKGKIEEIIGDDANELKIGHTYFLKLIEDAKGNPKEPEFQDLKNIWFYSIVPLLEEYVGFEKEKLSELLTIKEKGINFLHKNNFVLEGNNGKNLFKAFK